jgi:hypothetical protein
MHKRIPIEQLTSFFSNPTPRTRIPEEKMNNQESIKIKRTHIQGQEASLSVKLLWNIVRLEIRCARTVTPSRWMIALSECTPEVGYLNVPG